MLKRLLFRLLLVTFFLTGFSLAAQDYYYEDYKPFDESIPTPEEFLEYPIGDYHTRHDLVLAYLNKLAEVSDKASISVYGKTHENRKLVILTIGKPENLSNLETIRQKHLEVVDPNTDVSDYSDLPLFVNLAYGVHGNEPSSTEAALLIAYTLVASESEQVKEFLDQTIVFLDPTINPDGRDRHSNWANTYRGNPLVADKNDIEHNEGWPRGRTNHYWFDLNRDLLLAVNPESTGRLKWYHDWYPNVVTDYHEMGTNSTYFFEPKNKSASLNPITPKENRDVLNKVFADEYSADLDKIGSLYFTDEVFDATYPGYGSTYMDLQGSLALLFEQASSRGHLQETTTGEIDFAFTIRNQFVTSIATLKAAVKNKELLYGYQNDFFKKSLQKAGGSKIKGYVFGDNYDKNRNKAFVDLLLKHQIEVYPLNDDMQVNGKTYKAGQSYVVPTYQKQHYLVQSLFETYDKYRDSVYYDTSAWSMVNFYNLRGNELGKLPGTGDKLTPETNKISLESVSEASYAYIVPYDDYYAPALLYQLLDRGIVVKTSSKPFSMTVNGNNKDFARGSLMVPVADQNQEIQSELNAIMNELSAEFSLQVYGVDTGWTTRGNGLGSRSLMTVNRPNVMLVVEGTVRSYEAGEIWHLFENRMQMPLVKVPERIFYKTELDRYNVIIMVSGTYKLLNKRDKERLKAWVAKGNTLITTAKASSWAIQQKLVKEALISKPDSLKAQDRMDYGDSRGSIGKQNLGGAIFSVDLDVTHPIGFGYSDRYLPVYKNNQVFMAPSKNRFSTVARYTSDPHIDGFISPENLELMKKSASIVVSKIGKGRVVLFADNPNFRSAWYGTNKLLMNAVLFGDLIKVPAAQNQEDDHHEH